MVNKIVWFTIGLTLFLLCSCVEADVLYEGIEGSVADSATYVEPDETASRIILKTNHRLLTNAGYGVKVANRCI